MAPIWLLALAALLTPAHAWTHSWGTVGDMLWADFAGAGYAYMLTPEQIHFVASTYAIVSVEKCFAERNFTMTEDAVLALSAQFKAINPAIKTLMYYSSTTDFSDCYRAGAVFEGTPSWWLRNDAGVPYGTSPRHDHDTTLADVRAYWLASIANVTAPAGGAVDGVFADGTLGYPYAGMSPTRNAAVVAGLHAMLNDTRTALKGIVSPDFEVIGNGLAQYGEPADGGVAVLPFVDGVCWEHFMAFEMLDPKNGTLIPALFDAAVALIANVSAQGKTVLVKTWPGPATTPILPLGPSWPGGNQPDTYAGRADAASAWLPVTLAGFLIVVQPNVYLSYSTWYTAPDGYYPCPPGECSTPENWFPEFAMPLGAPTGPATRVAGGSGWVYRREFAAATVLFDAGNVTASVIQWG